MGSGKGGGGIVKQHINFDQLHELTPEQRARLDKWWQKKTNDFFGDGIEGEPIPIQYTSNYFRNQPLLLIGQMIELLASMGKRNTIINNVDYNLSGWGVFLRGQEDGFRFQDTASELCDVLWQAVKEAL